MSNIKEDIIIAQLKKCMDPEIPVDLWNLGLIYSIGQEKQAAGQTKVLITMSLTTPGCAMKNYLAEDVKAKVGIIDGVSEVEVQVVWEPRWNPAMMSPEARTRLGI